MLCRHYDDRRSTELPFNAADSPTLGLVHQLKFILEQPFVICALDNRARLARNLLAALLFIAFRAVMAVSIPSIALGALLFRGGKPCTWESGASYYAYMTGQTLITPVKQAP